MSAIFNISGRVAIVTGSSSGQGRAVAFALASEGAKIVCSDLTPDVFKARYDEDCRPTHEIIALNGDAVFQKADVSDENDMRQLLSVAVKIFGRVDICCSMFNNAGVFMPPKNIVEESLENFNKIMGINAGGCFLCMKYIIRQMMTQEPLSIGDRGSIVNISSTAAWKSMPGVPLHCASKSTSVALIRTTALDYAKHCIRVNAVCPGTVLTGMVRGGLEDPDTKAFVESGTPWPSLGEPADIGKAALFLCSDASSWTTGATLTVDGGMMCT